LKGAICNQSFFQGSTKIKYKIDNRKRFSKLTNDLHLVKIGHRPLQCYYRS
jgi:hypothetical protein